MIVNFTYFKENGNYYSEGHEDIYEGSIYESVLEKAIHMLDTGKRPGLVDGNTFHCLITMFTIDGPLTHLYIKK